MRVIHHHFTISHCGAEKEQEGRTPRNLLMSQDLVISLDRNSREVSSHEHRFHQLTSDTDREELKQIIRNKDLNVEHRFYDAFRSIDHVIASNYALDDLPSLRRCLRWALRAELATIPPYLFAAYSLKDQDYSVCKLLKSIAAEEMLHAGLVANLLVAIGGVPMFYDQKTDFNYPSVIDHMGGLSLGLLPLGPEALRQFLLLEQPQPRRNGAPARPMDESGEFRSIGELYGAIEAAVERLERDGHDIFANPRPALQLSSQNYKVVEHNVAESGGLHPILNLSDARAAIHTIVTQGEGSEDVFFADENNRELTHFRKLQEIALALPEAAVLPLQPNPRLDKSSEHVLLGQLFNASYSLLLLTLQELYSEADLKGQLNARMYVIMEKIMRPVANYMCQNLHVGPSFEAFAFETDPVEQVIAMAQQALKQYPSLEKLAVAIQKMQNPEETKNKSK